jgi:hypothetical protein
VEGFENAYDDDMTDVKNKQFRYFQLHCKIPNHANAIEIHSLVTKRLLYNELDAYHVAFHDHSFCALLATLDTLVKAVVGGLFLEALIPKQSSSLARERVWNPTKRIGDAPDSHTDASLHSKTALGNSLISLRLGGKLRRGGGSVHANVHFSVNNINIQGSEAAEDGLEGRLTG